MQRVSDIIDKKYKGFSKVIRIRRSWPEIVGEVLGAHTEPVQIKGKTLWVLCDSPVWVQQVDILSPALLPRIYKIGKARVDKIEAKFAAAKANPVPEKKAPCPSRRYDIDPSDVEKITNPGLKKAIKKLLEG